MRNTLFVLMALGVTGACVPPEHLQSRNASGFGVGATGYAAPSAITYGAPSGAAGVAEASGAIPSSEINRALFGTTTAPGAVATAPVPQPVLTQPPSTPTGVAVAAAGPTVAPGQAVVNPGISDEQDFQAVSARETIESDKARIEANKAQYQVIPPTDLPQRSAAAGVSPIIDYALHAPNRLGQAIYARRPISEEAHRSACLRYPTPEAAQEAFLKAGGPKRDGKKLDPDGDGFACEWDPTPFQQARSN